MQKANPKKNLRKPQHQSRPAIESKMSPEPNTALSLQPNWGKLEKKVALIKVGEAYLFLASSDDAYITGQVIYPHSGEIVNG